MTSDLAELISERRPAGSGATEDALRAIASLNPKDVSPELERAMLGALSETEDARLRNVLAVALAEMPLQAAAPRIVDRLHEDRTRGSRGTLLYALQKLGQRLPLPDLVRLISSDTSEAQEEAFEMLEASASLSRRTELAAAIAALFWQLLFIRNAETRGVVMDAVKTLWAHLSPAKVRVNSQ